MLDTNTVSWIIRGAPAVVRERLVATPMSNVCISSITAGELRYGLAKRPDARRLAEAVEAFLRRVEVSAWDAAAARAYGGLRAELEAAGTPLGNLDLLIAAHAQATGAILVTGDIAFTRVGALEVVDWAV
jgi:tRNA(fMet)-specific endonuclease VapC